MALFIITKILIDYKEGCRQVLPRKPNHRVNQNISINYMNILYASLPTAPFHVEFFGIISKVLKHVMYHVLIPSGPPEPLV